MAERKFQGVNNFIGANLPADMRWDELSPEELVDARSAYGAIFGVRIQQRVDTEFERNPDIRPFLAPSLDQIVRRNPGKRDKNLGQHTALKSKVDNIHQVTLIVDQVAILLEEQALQALPEDDQARIDYQHLLKLFKLTQFASRGFSFERDVPRSPFFKHFASGFETLPANVRAFVHNIFPKLYWEQFRAYPPAELTVRVGENSYGLPDTLASSDNGAIAKTEAEITQQYVYDPHQEVVDMSPAFIARLRENSAGLEVNGCPFRRSGVLLAPYVEGRKFNPTPLKESYATFYKRIRG